MEEADRGLPTEENPEIWAQLVPGALTQNRQAFLAAWMAGRALRNRLIFRLVAGLAALAAVLGITAWALHALLDGTPVALWQCLLPLLFALSLLLALKDIPLHRQLRRTLRRIQSATLFPDHLHLVLDTGEQDLSLADLALVQRFDGWTVLVWQDGLHPLIVPIPDSGCNPRQELPYARLREAVPGTRFQHSWGPPKRKRHLIIGFLILLVAIAADLMLFERALGLRFFLNRNSTSDFVLVGYAQNQNRLIGDNPQYFGYPAVGEPKFQWFSNRCCAVTYPSADGSVRVQLLESLRGDVARLDPDPPTGEWTGEDLVSGTLITLRWDEDNRCYHLLTGEQESIYRQWEDFDGLGIALCNEKGLPEWTVTPSISPLALLFNGEAVPTLELCPVSMEDTQSMQLYSADGKDTEVSTPESADLPTR